jgi:23S rRNA pseudouridine1911/1915/1917 synthase
MLARRQNFVVRRSGGRGRLRDLQIIYEDDDMIVVNKPAGLLAVPLPLRRREAAASVHDLLKDYFRSRKRRPFVVHRIDRDTSGLVVFAKSADAQAQLKEQFQRREPDRVYWAVVSGHPEPQTGIWSDHLVWDRKGLIQRRTHARDPRGKEAVSDYRVLERFRDAALIEVRLKTGKRNQIRIQAGLRGHELVGEQRYVFGAEALRTIPFPRQALHAYRVTLRHPKNGRLLEFEAPLPGDLVELIARLRRGQS